MLNGIAKYLVAVLLACLAALTWVYHSVKADALKLRTQNTELVQENTDLRNVADLTSAVLSARVESSARIKTVTKEIVREIPARIPDDACALPPGWRLLHDAAAAGQVPEASAGADGAPVPAQTAALTMAENYGTCLDNADRLDKLQTWVKGVSE